jgi:hypothetical protein
MNTCQKIQLEIQIARVRREWTITLRELRSGKPALERFIDESTRNLARLAATLSTQDQASQPWTTRLLW